ncbi:hypothetical protein [Rhizobium cauense]|uniref:hypothetical protein n=1 Tax=Rhizobium cauense TaxID=1166683 RepID=UPI001CB76E25|nr:hypothetical protein [Rhizobium cauense]
MQIDLEIALMHEDAGPCGGSEVLLAHNLPISAYKQMKKFESSAAKLYGYTVSYQKLAIRMKAEGSERIDETVLPTIWNLVHWGALRNHSTVATEAIWHDLQQLGKSPKV